MISPVLAKYKERVVLSGALWRSFTGIKLDKAETGSSEWLYIRHLVLSPALDLWFPLGALSIAEGPEPVTPPSMG